MGDGEERERERGGAKRLLERLPVHGRPMRRVVINAKQFPVSCEHLRRTGGGEEVGAQVRDRHLTDEVGWARRGVDDCQPQGNERRKGAGEEGVQRTEGSEEWGGRDAFFVTRAAWNLETDACSRTMSTSECRPQVVTPVASGDASHSPLVPRGTVPGAKGNECGGGWQDARENWGELRAWRWDCMRGRRSREEEVTAGPQSH